MCIVSNNHVFGNVALIEQDITNVLISSNDADTQQNSFNNTIRNTHVLSEPYSDLNNNGKYDYAEEYLDENQNGICDIQEPFIDKGNSIYDVGEEFVDVNSNNKYDLELWYVDKNRNGKWDVGDPFEDLNNDGIKDYNEPFIDQNNNNRYDAPEKTGDSKFSFSAIAFSEPFIDVPNGWHDLSEEYEDLNGDGKWTPAEEYEDFNSDGKWTPAEEFEDLNGDGKWTAGNGQHDPIEKSILNQQDVYPLIYDTLKTSLQNDIISNISPYKRSFKSPGKALLFSGVLPGMGQLYMENWMRALLFVSIDVAAISAWYHNNNLAEDKKKEYSYYANDHWDFGRWVHDYYKWYPEDSPDDFLGNEELWGSIREVFVNKSDSIGGCHEPPYCYTDIWEHSHSIEFTWNGEKISSNSNDFIQSENNQSSIFELLCGDNTHLTNECSNDTSYINEIISENKVYVIKDHHFYEGIQKYDMYFAGWDDNDSVFVNEKEHGDKNATSPNQIAYRNLWGRYNTIKTLAVNGGKFMLINRVVSMMDALLLAKKWNNKHDVKLSLNAYPDLRNKSGVGGVKLSLYWK